MMVESWILGEKVRWDYQYAKTQSPIERKVYNALRGKYPLKTQVPCGAYSIDIAIPRYRIAIETDGHSNHSTPEQKARDQRKDRYLKAHGWMVLRFSGSEVNGKLKWVLAQIHQHVEACRSPRRPRTMQAMRKAAKRKMIKREGK